MPPAVTDRQTAMCYDSRLCYMRSDELKACLVFKSRNVLKADWPTDTGLGFGPHTQSEQCRDRNQISSFRTRLHCKALLHLLMARTTYIRL